MSFTYDITTNRGRVRLKIGDTTSTAYSFEDAEIDAFLSEGGSVNGACRLALQTLLASRALRVKRYSLPGQSYDDTAQIEALKTALESYGGGLPTVSVVFTGNADHDSGFTDPTS